jgi:hypothetical protein
LRDRPVPPPGVSPQARSRFQAELDASLADTRTAWAAATLRGDAALQAGDREAAVRALDEQRALLRDLHARVDSAVGRAAVERDAESIVAGAGARPVRRRGGSRQRRQAAVALAGTIGIALAALLTLSPQGDHRVPDVAPVAEADDVTVSSTADAGPTVVTFDRLPDVLLELDAPDTGHGVRGDVEVEGRPELEGSPGEDGGRSTPRLDTPLVETDDEGTGARSLGGR